MLPDSGKSSLCPQEVATLGLLFRPCKVYIWYPQLRVDEKVFGGWALVSWLQRMETPEEVSLGDGTLGTKMVKTSGEGENNSGSVEHPAFWRYQLMKINFTILSVASLPRFLVF